MIDYLSDFSDALNNLKHWKQNYPQETYIHRKLLVNIMFRAYCTNAVYEALQNNELIAFDSVDDAVNYIEDFYYSTCQATQPFFIDWLRDNQQIEIGTVSHRLYQCMAYEADDNPEKLYELEFAYVFEHLSDVFVLYYIAYRLTRRNSIVSLKELIGIFADKEPDSDLYSLKEFIQENFVMPFMTNNYPTN